MKRFLVGLNAHKEFKENHAKVKQILENIIDSLII